MVALSLLVLALGVGVVDTPRAGRGAECAVVDVTRHPVPGRAFNVGNRRIAVVLPPDATFIAVPENEPGWAWVQEDGWIRAKVGWWTARGKPRVVGRRLDGPAPPLRADVGAAASDGVAVFYPSLLYFPSTGCWKLTATAGGARLDAVVLVVKA